MTELPDEAVVDEVTCAVFSLLRVIISLAFDWFSSFTVRKREWDV